MKAKVFHVKFMVGDKKFNEIWAGFAWKMFTKLKNKGFTDDQAMKIVSGMSKTK